MDGPAIAAARDLRVHRGGRLGLPGVSLTVARGAVARACSGRAARARRPCCGQSWASRSSRPEP